MTLLGVDVGTTGTKMGVYRTEGDSLNLIGQFSREYEVNVYNNGLFGDIEQEKWETAFIAGCKQM